MINRIILFESMAATWCMLCGLLAVVVSAHRQEWWWLVVLAPLFLLSVLWLYLVVTNTQLFSKANRYENNQQRGSNEKAD